MRRKSVASSQEKVDYLKKHFLNINKINPYTDRVSVDEIKVMLCDQGFYSTKPHFLLDSIIINLILQAQGKKRIYNRNTAKNRMIND